MKKPWRYRRPDGAVVINLRNKRLRDTKIKLVSGTLYIINGLPWWAL